MRLPTTPPFGCRRRATHSPSWPRTGRSPPTRRTRCRPPGSWPVARATRSSWSAAGPATSCRGRDWSWPASRAPAATAPTRTPASSSTTTGAPPGAPAASSSRSFTGSRPEAEMYVPAAFAAPDDALDQLLSAPGAVDLVSRTADGLTATTLPMLHDAATGTLTGHLARSSPQWRDTVGDVPVIVQGPDAYVSPGWYASKAEHGRVVPTWNYITAHVHGELVVHDDPVWVEGLVRRLTAKHEASLPHPWAVDDAPAPFVAGQLRAIVGVELLITRIEAKAKLSQNRPEADVAGVVAGLEARGDRPTADAVRTANGDR